MSLEDEHRRNLLRATAHPLRLQMLSLLTGAQLSAAEVARELGITQANASYHLRFLLDAGLLVVAGEEQVRGGRAKKYRHLWDSAVDAQAGVASEADRQAYVSTLAAAIPARYADREPGPQLFTDADLWLRPEVWLEAFELLERASRLVHEQAQPPRTTGTVRANLSVAAFPMQPGSRGTR
ncbi:winged helix-turn-helix domain-containing protein [Intrasporangium sp.]|uniref:ArsR/SmtB family transcription factor n=1 Tax=Intrasporangium sp. TaxID=1925024 RepID=UPI003221F37F